MVKPGFLSKIKNFFSKVKDKAKPVINKVKNAFDKIVNVGHKVAVPFNKYLKTIKPILDPVMSAIPVAGPVLKTITDVEQKVVDKLATDPQGVKNIFSGTFSQDGKSEEEIRNGLHKIVDKGVTMASEMKQNGVGSTLRSMLEKRRPRSTSISEVITEDISDDSSEDNYSSWEKSEDSKKKNKKKNVKKTVKKIPNFIQKKKFIKSETSRAPSFTETFDSSDEDSDSFDSSDSEETIDDYTFTPGRPPNFLSKKKTITTTTNDIPFLNNQINKSDAF